MHAHRKCRREWSAFSLAGMFLSVLSTEECNAVAARANFLRMEASLAASRVEMVQEPSRSFLNTGATSRILVTSTNDTPNLVPTTPDSNGTESTKTKLYLGWISSQSGNRSSELSLGREARTVFQMTIDAVNRDSSLLPEYTIVPVFGDSAGDDSTAAEVAAQLATACAICAPSSDAAGKRRVHALIGDTSQWLTRTEATVAGAFNIPTISWVPSEVLKYGGKSSPLVVRSAPDLSFWMQAIGGLINHLNLNKITLITTGREGYWEVGYQASTRAKQEKWTTINYDFEGTTPEELKKVLSETDFSSRQGYLIFGKGRGFNAFLDMAIEAGGMDKGKVWIYGDSAASLNTSSLSVQKASFITLQQSEFTDPRWSSIEERWKQETSTEWSPNNAYYRENDTPPASTQYVYDSVLTFVHGVRNILSRSSDEALLFDGKALVSSMTSYQFEGVTGVVAYSSNNNSRTAGRFDIMNSRSCADGLNDLQKIGTVSVTSKESTVALTSDFCFCGNTKNLLQGDENQTKPDNSRLMNYLLGTAAFVIVVLSVCYWTKTRKMKRRTGQLQAQLEFERSSVPKSAIIKTADLVIFDKELGRGVSGVVYLGKLRGTLVAVKKLSGIELSGNEALLKTKLQEEARLMASLRHPNIVLFMGCCLEEGNLCIVSQYCSAGSLHDVLQDSSIELPWVLRLKLALDAARGLLYMHTFHPPLIHRDVKSLNILVDESWNAKLADFGTLRVAEAAGRQSYSLNDRDRRESENTAGHNSSSSFSDGANNSIVSKENFPVGYLIEFNQSVGQRSQPAGLASNVSLNSRKSQTHRYSTTSIRRSGVFAASTEVGGITPRASNTAGQAHSHSASTILTSSNVGTVRWSAPEMLVQRVIRDTGYRTKKFQQVFAYSEAVDIYSFGVVLWELVTRRIPFEDFTFLADIEKAVISGIRPKIPESCPEEFRALIGECWDNEEESRPKCSEVVDRLQKMYSDEISGGDLISIGPLKPQWTVDTVSHDDTDEEPLETGFVRMQNADSSVFNGTNRGPSTTATATISTSSSTAPARAS